MSGLTIRLSGQLRRRCITVLLAVALTVLPSTDLYLMGRSDLATPLS